MLSLLRRLFALCVFGGLLYALSIYAVSDLNSQIVLSESKTSPFKHLGGQPLMLSSDAMVHQSREQASDSVKGAEALALSALLRNPSSGRAASQLLTLYELEGDRERADQIADLAGRLWPSHTFTRSRLAEYWLARDQLDRVLDEWNILLVRNPKLRARLFPFLLNIISDSHADVLMDQFIKAPPVWWNGFFIYLSRELPIERLSEVYQARVQSSEGVSDMERRSYVNRLIREGNWKSAYDIWSTGLERHQARYSGLVFDGGFESGVFNQGFAWQFSRSKNPKIKPDITYGIKGRRALQITLRKEDPINFRHVSQRLLLKPGFYGLSYRYRTDTLDADKGLSWRIRCIDGGKSVLAEGKPMLGVNPWTTQVLSFEVPESCNVQLLRLEATSRFRHEQFFAGKLWIDDVVVSESKAEK